MTQTAGSVPDMEMEIALAQCAIAFGRGANNVEVSLDGVKRLMDKTRPLIVHHLADWNNKSGPFLDYAEKLGRLAAYITLGNAKASIDSKSVDETIKRYPFPCKNR